MTKVQTCRGRSFHVRLGLALVLALGLSASPARAQKRSASGLDVRGWPTDIRKGHADFERKCADCHELQLALKKRYAPRTWRRYIARMMKKEDGGLDAPTGRSIYRFLTYYGTHRPDAPTSKPQKTPTPAPPPKPEAAPDPFAERPPPEKPEAVPDPEL